MHEQELYAARRRLMARRHHEGQLRLRAVLLSLALFGIFWALVFAQMVSGHDPVLSAKAAAANGGRPQQSGARRRTESAPQPRPIVEIPASASAPPAPSPPPPAPVTTSVS
jgi:hypothetical protein